MYGVIRLSTHIRARHAYNLLLELMHRVLGWITSRPRTSRTNLTISGRKNELHHLLKRGLDQPYGHLGAQAFAQPGVKLFRVNIASRVGVVLGYCSVEILLSKIASGPLRQGRPVWPGRRDVRSAMFVELVRLLIRHVHYRSGIRQVIGLSFCGVPKLLLLNFRFQPFGALLCIL